MALLKLISLRRVPNALERGTKQKWPTSGRMGYISLAAWGVPNASKRGTKSEVAHKWAHWLPQPSRLGVPNASERGT